MFERFIKYIESHDLCEPGDKILVALSGGIDSVVMLDLLARAGFRCKIAHCNFQLRGEESDLDEEFVISLGRNYGIETFVKKFDTSAYAKKMGISTQMAARDLRYEWFNELHKTTGSKAVAIAHNADDNVETFHINLVRGTGLAGLTGMNPKSGIFIRPLLWAGRKEINDYRILSSLSYREDSSNAKTHYKRNFLRHRIIPELNKLNPSYSETILQSMEFFRQSERVLSHYYDSIIPGLITHSGKNVEISLAKLKNLPEPSWFLFRYLSDYGFNSAQVKDIANSIEADPGKQFACGGYLLVKDRDYFILKELQDNVSKEYYIDSGTGQLTQPVELSWVILDSGNFNIDPDLKTASLDASKIRFPLKLRKWRKGDSFQPYGMRHKKKLSDFFIDNKISIIEKDEAWLLISGDDIVWLVGYRIDDRYKVTTETKKVFRIELNKGHNS